MSASLTLLMLLQLVLTGVIVGLFIGLCVFSRNSPSARQQQASRPRQTLRVR